MSKPFFRQRQKNIYVYKYSHMRKYQFIYDTCFLFWQEHDTNCDKIGILSLDFFQFVFYFLFFAERVRDKAFRHLSDKSFSPGF